MTRTRFLSTGFRVPDRVVTNHELEGMMETSDEWIRQRSGIEERRWAAEDETGADLAEAAARMALERAGMEAAELDCIILATLSPDHFFPGTGRVSAAPARRDRHPLPGREEPVHRLPLRALRGGCVDPDGRLPAGAAGGGRIRTPRASTCRCAGGTRACCSETAPAR